MSIDGDRFLKERVRYTVTDVGERDIINPESEKPERRRCYEFEVSRMELAATTQPQDPGRNRVLLHILGQPLGLSGSEGIVRQGCVEMQYNGPTSKNPIDGQVRMDRDALEALHQGFDTQMQRISKCVGIEDLVRPDVEDLVLECLPPRLRLGDYLFDRDEVIAMVRRYYERNLTSKIPTEPSEFFVPIELFDADEHCYRAWETPRMTELLTALADKCKSCAWVSGPDSDSEAPSGGVTADANTGGMAQ